MTVEEFKITIRAFFPTIGFSSCDCGDTYIVMTDYFYRDDIGEGKPFKLICNEDGTFSVWYGAMTLNIEEYPNLLADTAKDMKHKGWYPMFYRFMRGG